MESKKRGRKPAQTKVEDHAKVRESENLNIEKIEKEKVNVDNIPEFRDLGHPAEKVIDVKVGREEPEVIHKAEPKSIARKNPRLNPVIINGKERMITKLSYQSIMKDPRFNVILPKGSPYHEENCVNC